MDRFRLTDRKKQEPLPEDIYPAKLTKVTPLLKGDFPGLRLTFRPLVSKYADKIATCVGWGQWDEEDTEKSNIIKNSKLHKWLTTLNNSDPDISELKPQELVGAKCRIDVSHSEPSDEGTIYANVMRILPLKSKADEDDADEDSDEKPKKKHHNDDDDEEQPKKKHHDDDDDEEQPKKKHHHDDDEDSDDEPKKKHSDDDDEDKPKKKHSDDDEDEDKPKKKHDDDDEDKPKKKRDDDDDEKPKKGKKDDDDIFSEEDDF